MTNSSAFSKLKTVALSAAVLSAAIASGAVFSNAAHAQSAQGETKIKFEVNPFVRLYYKESVTITLNPSDKEGASAIVDKEAANISATYDPDAGVSGDGDVNVTSSSQNAKGIITLKNFWAVQSIAKGKTMVTVTGKEQKAQGPNESAIFLPDFEVSESFTPTGLAGTQKGDIELMVDMTDAKYAGTYEGAVINIKAENL